VKIDGDSMEPYIRSGSVALCRRGEIIRDGDVGLFFVDGDMKCKQYCRDYAGNVHLFFRQPQTPGRRRGHSRLLRHNPDVLRQGAAG
jgi:SOS-response transcriptional repressor LexA